MLSIGILLVLGLAAIAAMARFRTRTPLIGFAGLVLGVGLAILMIVVYGPRDLWVRFPWLPHPWILGGIGSLGTLIGGALLLGIGLGAALAAAIRRKR